VRQSTLPPCYRTFLIAIVFTTLLIAPCVCVSAQDDEANQRLAVEAKAGLDRAVRFFRDEVSTEGGYLWRYSEDLATREGEGTADEYTVWVQPPGTPSVGIALLGAYRATDDPAYLAAATDAGHCLVQGQLASGGWDYRIAFESGQRARYAYRVELGEDANTDGLRNTSVFDDNTTQAAMRLLMELDRELEFKDDAIHEAVLIGLETILAVQYPIGAWPQRFESPLEDPDTYPVLKASYPDDWPQTYPGTSYKDFYTFNDNAIADVVNTLLLADAIYDDPRLMASVRKAGDFVVAAQMPDPQPAWAQQYNRSMHPAWARKFEPASITGGESQGVMRLLITIYRATGDRKYLEPVPRALDYLESSLLSSGQLARFYELKTNRPIYFTRDTYIPTYSDADMPTHYAFKVSSSLGSIRRQYEAADALSEDELETARELFGWIPSPQHMTPALANNASAALDSLDEQGRWIEEDTMRYWGHDDQTRRVINCLTFIQNVEALSRYLGAAR
jgi:hypothetical protein